jgi:flagellar motor switch protein FliM
MLLQQFMGEKFGRDSIWETHLADELWGTDIDLDVVLDEQIMRLADVVSFKPGDRLMLNTTVGAPVQVRCGTVPLFQAHVGRRKNKVAVRIESSLERKSVAGPEA